MSAQLRPLRSLAGLIAPPRCAACGAGCEPAELLCADCAAALAANPVLEPGPPGIALAVAAGGYHGRVREIAHALKFGRHIGLAREAAAAIAAACPEPMLEGALVPVPPARFRRLRRGFDPAEELALALGAVTGRSLARCLRRRSGPRQVGRPRADRLADPPRVSARGPVPRLALLVDDVHTTGATLAACAEALRSAGCEGVVALTLARSR
jgi:predicted amidophosphoribosyltransferase